jgi:YVTN family beta-propeller protein
MLSFRRDQTEATLIERYWLALRHNRAASVPEGLDPELAAFVVEVDIDLAPPALSATTIDRLWHQVENRVSEANRSGWSGPAIDPSTRRRNAAPPITEREEQPIMSEHVQPADIEPIPIQQRRWFRETLKLVAAAIVFIIVGAVLALTLRSDDDQTPAVGPSGPTPTPTVQSTATSAAVVPVPTEPAATSTSEPAATTTPEPSPTSALPEFGAIVATIPVGELPRHMAASDDALWVTNSADGTVSRIDIATNQVVATINVVPDGQAVTGVDGATQVDAIAVGGGAVWVTALNSAQLVRIDPATNEVVARISLSAGVHELEYGGDALWGKGSFSNTILRIDPATNTVVASIPVPPPGSFVYLNDALWVQTLNDVVKIDPATNTVVATVRYSDATSPSAGMMRAAGGSLWVTSLGIGPTIVQIDPVSATVVNRVALPEGVEEVLIAGSSDALYACPCFEAPDNTVLQIDPETLEYTASLFVPYAYWIEFEAGALWSYDRSQGVVTRVEIAP